MVLFIHMWKREWNGNVGSVGRSLNAEAVVRKRSAFRFSEGWNRVGSTSAHPRFDGRCIFML